MRIGQRHQLVLVVLQRLVIARLSDLDREQVVRNGALVHDDIRKDRLARDDRRSRRWCRAAAAACVRRAGRSRNRPPSPETAVRHAPPAGGSARARRDRARTGRSHARKVLQRGDHLVQLGVHVPPHKHDRQPDEARRIRGSANRDGVNLRCGYPSRCTRCRFRRRVPIRSRYICTSISRGPGFGDRLGERLVELVGGGDRAARHAHALGQRDEIERRPVDLQHVVARAGRARRHRRRRTRRAGSDRSGWRTRW